MGSGFSKKAKSKVEASKYTDPPSSKLDLSNCDMRNFARGLFKMPYLTELNLAHNLIMVIPEKVNLLTELTSLDLSFNNLTNISPNIGELSKLVTLSIEGNSQISNLPDFPNLRVLNISGTSVPTLPANMKLPALEVLKAESLSLTGIPPSVLSHASLKELYLGNNGITQLAADIASLKNLKVLNLRGNKIRTFPPEIGALASLETIDISNKKISS